MSTDFVPSWGRRFHFEHHLLQPHWRDQASIDTRYGPVLPYGNGRSYGDSCLNDGHTLIRTTDLKRILAIDPREGTLVCEAGVLLADILELIVPHGWFLPVTPGTRFVTVGGAIANDVHGKNHHRNGTFGNQLLEMELLGSHQPEAITLSPEVNSDLFNATIGGLGLTGLILTAKLRLQAINNPWMQTETVRFHNLAEFFQLSRESDQDFEHTVSWIDCVARGKQLGRGLFMRANHAPANITTGPKKPTKSFSLPLTPPISLVNQLSLKLFNQFYYHRQYQDCKHSIDHYEPYFYPLDGLHHWNRMYGPRGFTQHQCQLPREHGEAAVAELLRLIAASGKGSFLAVIKVFGDVASPGLLSFPRPGVTLALDFPWHGRDTEVLLQSLDSVVREAGGRVYPAKDSRMSADDFQHFYPELEQFIPFVDPAFSSSLWRRLKP